MSDRPTLRLQVFRPLVASAVNAWLAENPGIHVKGMSVAAGVDDATESGPLSICAILYEPPPGASGVTTVALAEAEQLIEEVTSAEERRDRASNVV